MLGRVDPDDLQPVTVTPSADLFARMSAAAAGQQPAQRLRSRTWALVAAVVLAVLGVGAGITVWATGTGEQTASVSARSRPRHRHWRARRRTAARWTSRSPGCVPARSAEWSPSTTTGSGTCRRLAGVGRRGREWVGWADVDRAALAGAVVLGDGGRELARVTF